MNVTAQKSDSTHNADQAELDKFSALASRWWDPESEFKPLHAINPLRLGWIRQYAGSLAGKNILDVGCGGGILSESMAAEGANVTGIDLADKSLKVARLHGLESGVKVDYRLISAEDMARQHPGQYDIVTCMEMLEHVPDPGSILAACRALLKPGGQLFLSTINRTPAAFAVAILGAEYIARLLPPGTHSYQEFITPAELARWVREQGLDVEDVSGMAYEPWAGRARLSRNTAINYLMAARLPLVGGSNG